MSKFCQEKFYSMPSLPAGLFIWAEFFEFRCWGMVAVFAEHGADANTFVDVSNLAQESDFRFGCINLLPLTKVLLLEAKNGLSEGKNCRGYLGKDFWVDGIVCSGW